MVSVSSLFSVMKALLDAALAWCTVDNLVTFTVTGWCWVMFAGMVRVQQELKHIKDSVTRTDCNMIRRKLLSKHVSAVYLIQWMIDNKDAFACYTDSKMREQLMMDFRSLQVVPELDGAMTQSMERSIACYAETIADSLARAAADKGVSDIDER